MDAIARCCPSRKAKLWWKLLASRMETCYTLLRKDGRHFMLLSNSEGTITAEAPGTQMKGIPLAVVDGRHCMLLSMPKCTIMVEAPSIGVKGIPDLAAATFDGWRLARCCPSPKAKLRWKLLASRMETCYTLLRMDRRHFMLLSNSDCTITAEAPGTQMKGIPDLAAASSVS